MYVNSICRFPRTFPSLSFFNTIPSLVFTYSFMHMNPPRVSAALVSPVFPLPSIQPRRMADSNRNEIVCKLICPRASWERSARTYIQVRCIRAYTCICMRACINVSCGLACVHGHGSNMRPGGTANGRIRIPRDHSRGSSEPAARTRWRRTIKIYCPITTSIYFICRCASRGISVARKLKLKRIFRDFARSITQRDIGRKVGSSWVGRWNKMRERKALSNFE